MISNLVKTKQTLPSFHVRPDLLRLHPPLRTLFLHLVPTYLSAHAPLALVHPHLHLMSLLH